MKLGTSHATQGQLSWHHALRHVAEVCGRNWKSKLKQAWENANIPPECDRGYYSVLIQIRNQMDDLDTYILRDKATLIRWQAEFDAIQERDRKTGNMLQDEANHDAEIQKTQRLRREVDNLSKELREKESRCGIKDILIMLSRTNDEVKEAVNKLHVALQMISSGQPIEDVKEKVTKAKAQLERLER